MGSLYKCQKGVMDKCPENKKKICDGTYVGVDCWCAKRNQKFMPESERDLLKKYLDTGLEPEDVRRLQKDWTGLILKLDEMGGMPHLNDLLAAEKDGRLVVLAKHGNYPFCCAEECGEHEFCRGCTDRLDRAEAEKALARQEGAQDNG